MRIDVGIPTFRRPDLLMQAIASVQAQRIPRDWSIRLLVVDNDAHAGARNLVTVAQRRSMIPLVYHHEPAAGVANARNCLLSLSTANFLVFLDDDEAAATDWLRELVLTAIKYDADAVLGPVMAALPVDSPRWVRAGKFFERPRFATGTLLEGGSAGNALLRMSTIRRLGVQFDPHLRFAGEDTAFFDYLADAGARLVWCDEAFVTEAVTRDRLKVRWHVSRALRSGQAFAYLFAPRTNSLRRAAWALRRAAIVAAAAILALPAWLLGKHWGVITLKKLASNMGQLLGARARDGLPARSS